MAANLKAFLTATFLAGVTLSMSGCTTTGPGGALTSSNLTQAQNAAGSIYQVIKTDAAIYTGLPGVTASQAATINLAVSSLGAAVSAFQSISSLGNVEQCATAVLSTASAVVNMLPNVSATDKAAITGAISIVEVLLPVVLPPTSPVVTAQATGPI